MSRPGGNLTLLLALAAVAGCGVKPPGESGYQVQQVDYTQGLCRIGLDRCQSISGYGSIDCIDRYQYCLTVMGPRSGYVPPSQRGYSPPLSYPPPVAYPPPVTYPPPAPPTAFGPPSPTEDVYYMKADPPGQPQPPQQQQQQRWIPPGRTWGR
ncbi:MAG: hypothetical protein FJZ01_16275 [Candidatus Sericytochromatia bacterium]|nr:hypothetical protein [Candidatus Tanganyikabacteria bacterium]